MYINDLINALRAARAPKGRAKDKKDLILRCEDLRAKTNSLAILQCSNRDSTYNGQFPETVGVAYDNALRDVEALVIEAKAQFL